MLGELLSDIYCFHISIFREFVCSLEHLSIEIALREFFWNLILAKKKKIENPAKKIVILKTVENGMSFSRGLFWISLSEYRGEVKRPDKG